MYSLQTKQVARRRVASSGKVYPVGTRVFLFCREAIAGAFCGACDSSVGEKYGVDQQVVCASFWTVLSFEGVGRTPPFFFFCRRCRLWHETRLFGKELQKAGSLRWQMVSVALREIRWKVVRVRTAITRHRPVLCIFQLIRPS